MEQKFQIVENKFDEKSKQMSIENSSLQKKIVEITEEHKAVMALNSKTMNSIVTMHEKALEDKTKELEVVKSTNLSLSKKIQELESIQTLHKKENNNTPESVSDLNKKDYVTSVHEGKKPRKCGKSVQCKICQKTLPNKNSLNSHVRGVHGPKKFECVQCDKKFSINEHLKSHMTTHTEQKPFSCKKCPKEFKHKSSLNAHVKRCKSKLLLQEDMTK